MDFDNFKGAGGTSGGVFQFLIGLAMAVTGAYMLISRVVVSSGSWSFGGYNTFGLSLIPLIFGIGFVFFNGKSIIGWLLVFVGSVIIISGILMNLNIYFQSTSLFNTIVMLILFAGGIGLIARSIIDRE
jgi:uncharacterized protein